MENSTIVQKAEDRPKWSAVACTIYGEYGNVIAAGVRCGKQNRGGCKRSSPCTSGSQTISDMIIALAGGMNADKIDLVQVYSSYDTQLALWSYDPDQYEHPDSLGMHE